MILKIGGGLSGTNKGSSKNSISYLEKENKMRDKTMRKSEGFFNEFEYNIAPAEAIKKLDSKKRGLKKDEAKFYNIILAPSPKELAELSDDDMKNYANKVMEEYAKHFNRGIDSNDVVWYAKLEHYRQEKGFKKKTKNKQSTTPGRKSGDFKPGDNRHIHILVRRKTEKNKSISPMVNNSKQIVTKGAVKGKTGFNRIEFSTKAETLLHDIIKGLNPNFNIKEKDSQAVRFLKKNGNNVDKAKALGFNKKHIDRYQEILYNARAKREKQEQEQARAMLQAQYPKVQAQIKDLHLDFLKKGKSLAFSKGLDFPVIASFKDGNLVLRKKEAKDLTLKEKNEAKAKNKIITRRLKR